MDHRGRSWVALAGAVPAAAFLLWLASTLGGAAAAAALALSLATPVLLWGALERWRPRQTDRLGAVALLLLSLPWAFLEPVVSVVHVVGAVVVLCFAGRPVRVPRPRKTASAPFESEVTLGRSFRLRRSRILLVEDNAANRFYGSMVLRKLGHPFEVASSGEQAVSMVARQHFDVVLMDLRMPGMDGVEAAAAIRSRVPPHQQPAIVALTADDRPETQRDLLRRGMDAYLAKPLRPEALAEALERLTGKPVVVAVR